MPRSPGREHDDRGQLLDPERSRDLPRTRLLPLQVRRQVSVGRQGDRVVPDLQLRRGRSVSASARCRASWLRLRLLGGLPRA
eukprot:3638591-Rhodomonas_salina.1